MLHFTIPQPRLRASACDLGGLVLPGSQGGIHTFTVTLCIWPTPAPALAPTLASLAAADLCLRLGGVLSIWALRHPRNAKELYA